MHLSIEVDFLEGKETLADTVGSSAEEFSVKWNEVMEGRHGFGLNDLLNYFSSNPELSGALKFLFLFETATKVGESVTLQRIHMQQRQQQLKQMAEQDPEFFRQVS